MGKYEYQSRVRYSECGEDCRLHLPGAVNYFQDAATFQGEDLGIGIPWMKEHHLAWILVSWQIIMDHMPRLGEPIRVSTWAYDFRNFYGLRNLLLEDEKGQPAVWANSVWVLMNTADRRPAKVSDSMIALYGQEEKLEMEYAPRRIRVPEGGEAMDAFAIHRGHLDSNHHVNNGQYIQMALDYLPDDFLLRETRVEYKEQSFLGDVITPVVVRSEDAVTVSLQKEDGKASAVVQFLAKEKKKSV